MAKSGIVAFVGKPNVGKSSLFNCFFNRKLTITSPKPQTTRNSLRSLYRFGDENIIGMIDTPGFHPAQNLLDRFLNHQIRSSVKETDIIVGLFEAMASFDDNDQAIIDLLNKHSTGKTIICLTKKDLATKQEISQKKAMISEKLINKIVPFVTISIKEDGTKTKLLNEIEQLLEQTDSPVVDESWQNTDNDNLIICETVRESCLELLKNEVPYGIDVEVVQKKYTEQSATFYIDANIIVEKESHKKILIGQNGEQIKKIGIASRKKLLQVYNCKVYLDLFVKVRKNWRNNSLYLNQRGYKV